MARKPKGSIIQPLPSWNLDSLYGTGFGIGPVPLGNLVASAVFNAQTDGSWLVIWDVQVFATGSFPAGGAVIDFCIIRGTQPNAAGHQIEPSVPITSYTASVPSYGWGFSDPANNEAGPVFASPHLPVNGYQWVHEWPLCAIAPGDSIVVYSDSNAYNSFGATWIFEVVPGGL